MDKPYYDAREVVPGVWQIMSSGDFSYCIAGRKRAVAIDTGYGAGNIRVYLIKILCLLEKSISLCCLNSHSLMVST